MACQFSNDFGDAVCPGVAYCADVGNTGHQCLCPDGYMDIEGSCQGIGIVTFIMS